jgi:hypothetical protein
MIDAQGQINHLHGFGNDFGTAAETREKMADVAVVLLDGEGQVFAGEELVFGDETVKAVPVVGEEGLAREADFIEELLTEPVPAKALEQFLDQYDGTKWDACRLSRQDYEAGGGCHVTSLFDGSA